MGLVERQKVLARLYTDGAWRERFFAHPETVGAEYGLCAEDIALLIAAGPQIRYFARSLISKRRQEVAKLLPLSCQTLAANFAPLFAPFALNSVPTGVHKHRADALAFADFILSDSPRIGGGGAIPWLPDLLRYEAAWLTMSDPTQRVLLRRFHYPMPALIRALAEGDTPQCSRRLTFTLWLRLTPDQPPRFFAWG